MRLDFDSHALLFCSVNPVKRKTVSFFALIIVVSAAFAGCFVWNYVKEGYDNFSAYFNTYYNASKAYEDGLQDVDDSKKAYELSVIAGANPSPFSISAKAKQDFDIAITKASKVLQLHPESEYTEDCLFMIGISYYYEGDDIRGERKFLEIESTFPNSGRYDEAEMYYGAFQLSGQENETGRDRVLNAIQIARQKKDRKIVAMSCDILSDYYLKGGDTLSAAAYLDTAATFSTGDDAAIYACHSGNLYSSLGNYASAREEYLRARDQARDIKLRFYSVYYLARVHRMFGKYSVALESLNYLRSDDKFFDFFPLIDYQEAEVLYDSGAVSKAVTMFEKIDTAYASTEAATRSAYKLANIYLYVVGDFPTALKYYQRVVSHPKVYMISEDGQQISLALQNYLVAGYKVLLSDSLYRNAAAAVERHDTTVNYSEATLDSLYEHAAVARQQLAGMFMFKLQMPDSAVRSYKLVLSDFPNSKVYPSVLYTLGEYYYSKGDSAEGKRYLEDLVTKYPQSGYAASACSVLRLPPPVNIDSAQISYSEAVALTKNGQYAEAVDTLLEVVRRNQSGIVPQALYTIGWIYENKLMEPDSAYAYYKELSTKYPGSTYSPSVTLALAGYESAQRDSAMARKQRSDSIAAARAVKEKADSTAHHPEQLHSPEQNIKMPTTPADTTKDSVKTRATPSREIEKKGR